MWRNPAIEAWARSGQGLPSDTTRYDRDFRRTGRCHHHCRQRDIGPKDRYGKRVEQVCRVAKRETPGPQNETLGPRSRDHLLRSQAGRTYPQGWPNAERLGPRLGQNGQPSCLGLELELQNEYVVVPPEPNPDIRSQTAACDDGPAPGC